MSGGVKKLAQVAVGAVIGFVQGGPVGAVIGAGLAFYAAEQQEKLNTKSPLRDNEPSAQTVRSSKAPARYILGRVSTGGVLVWAQEERGAQTTGEWLHLVYVLCEGAIDELESIYLGEELIGSYGADVSYELVVNPTQVNAFLKENCPDWKDTQIGRGLSYVRISLRYNAEKFPSGIPDVRFVVRGRNDIFDPRTGMSGWTDNTALHLLWFLRTRCGVPDDEIVFETFASGANVCDESVQNPDGSSSPRYRSGCVIGADEQRTNVLQKLEAACAGKLIRVGGRWMFQAGAYYGPYDFEITEDMVIGTITGNTEATNDAAINTIRGTFIDPQQSWTETDYPEVSVAQWVEEDGGEAAETLSFSYVSDPYQGQRLANIELRRRRSGGGLNIPLNLAGYNCRPGRAVRVNLPSLNILGEFMVTNWSMGTSEGCTVSVQAYEAAIFDDAVGKPYNPIGFIKLPAGGLGSPTNLRWDVEDTAEISQGVLSWDRPAGIVSGFAVTVRQAGTAVQAVQVPETTTRMPISGLTSGSYTMGVAALGPLARSGEATITVDVDGPPMPETCAVQATIDTITLIPGNTLHGLNGGTYEYFWSSDPAATQGEFLGRGLTITHTGLSFAKSYAYFVRSKNAYGVSAFLKVVAATSMDVGAILEGIKNKITESELGQELTSRIDLIDKDGPGSVNDRLGEVRDDLSEQIADVSNAVAGVDSALDQAKQDLQQQIDTIADLADSMPYKPDQAYTAGQGVLGEDGKLYQAKVDVPAGNPPPNATYWTDIGQAVQTANGLAARVQTNEAKVESLEGVTTAQSQQITGLQSSLTTTNGNVAAAQQAAEAAATLAGGKGKVIVQSAAPAVADRLAQNLWIDTTGNANTPKRWSGTAWVAVTDKVATDAAAAAANALAVAQTKADASVVQSLTTRVTEAEGSLSSQGQAITGLNNSLTTTNQNVTAAQQAAQAAATAAGAKGEVIYGSTAPAADKRLAQNLWIDTTSNANTPKRWNGSAWVAVTDKVATDAAAAAASALSQVATKAESSVVQTLTGRVTDAEGKLTTQGQSITGLQNSLTTTNQNVTAAQQAAQAASDAAGAKGKVLYQSTVPAVADRLTQNLWIDTTSNANTPKRWNGSAWVAVTDKVATDAAAAAANALSQVATKADASTVQSLTNTVEQQGAAITANGQALTSINASLAQAGGENLFYNPSFERVGSTAGLADGWTTGTPAGVTRTASLVASTLDPSGKAQRYDVSGIDNASRYLDTYHSPKFPAVSAGQFVSVSIYVKVTAGCLIRWYLQPRNAAGTTIVTQTPGNIVATGEWQRLVFEGREMPAGTVACPVIFRVFGASSTPQDAVVEIDRAQFEIGRIATGWRDNGQLAGADVAANASATTALAGRVTATETGLTAASGQITDLNNSIGDVGGENLFYNPTFTKAGTGGDIADGWATEGPATSVESLVTSWLNAGEKAVRVEVSSVGTGTPYKSLRPTGGTKDRRPMVAEGQTVAASIFLRGTAGLGFRFFIQWINAAGTVISAPNSVMFTITAAGKREQFSAVAPAGAVTCYVYLRIYSATGAVTAGYVEMARPQFEYGPRATGWRNNGQVNAVNNSATSAAVDSLTSTVDQQGSTLSSVAGRTTSLENSLTTTNQNVTAAQQAAQAAATAAGAKGEVIYGSTAPAADKRLAQNLWIDTTGNANTPKRWSGTAWVAVTDKVATDAAAAAASALSQVATKAEASAVNSLTNRVSTAEGTITSQSTDITQLKNSIGAAQPFVAGMTWEFTNSTRGWVATATGGTITAGPLFATVTKNPNLQCNFTPTVSGAQNPYLRIRLRRRNTTRSGAQMYWANEDGGLSEARRMAWAISTTTTDWQDIEIDLSGHAGWNGKNMYAIRLDMMNSADTTGEIDIAYIALGRRSAAASAQAVSSLDSVVTQQGASLTAESKRIDGLYTSVGDANAAIQSEATARSSGDAALGQRVDTVQSNLGTTNASVQQISTAQSALNGKITASYSVKLQVVNGNQYVAAGFGTGIENNNGVLQSVFSVIADRFTVLNPTNNGFVSPFAIQNGQVFINEAFISKATIQNGIVGSYLTSSQLTTWGGPVTTVNFSDGTIAVRHPTRVNTYTVMNQAGITVIVDNVVRVRMGIW
ncbi:DUF1983 domain-containing protein [Pseudomonas juntendi]|uniref:DUF1983 domain-containing protein n=1 Tax=Pseudomonas juntendi TaxID=2666183 RepID=A0A7W2LQA3_9PSED|nr:DUF1983 domain-containing protein [Pseudomonas juntendi]MBA6145084.1 DUF1983 domain-containing protein [Pseudomonas juntendi]